MSKDKYSQYAPLFGKLDDRRPKFFISQLLKQATDNMKRRTGSVGDFISEDCKLTTVTPGLKSKNFDVPKGDDEGVHHEWVTFLCDAMVHNIDTPTLVNMIKSLAGVKPAGSLEQLMQIVVQKLTSDITSPSGDVRMSPSQWGSVVSATAVGAGDRLRNLVSDRDLPVAEGGDQLLTKITVCLVSGTVTTNKYFNYNLNKLVQDELLTAANELKNQPLSISKAWDESTRKMGDDEFFRNAKGELCMKKNGVDVSIEIGSSEYRNLVKIENSCGTTGFTDKGKCADFLMKCLAGKDIQKCKEFLSDPAYWDIALDEVKKMTPIIAVNLLEAFEFSKESYQELVKDSRTNKTQDMKLNKFQCVSTWLEHIKTKVSEPEYKSINENNKLKGYLNLVRERVNSNPIILNPSYKVTNVIVNDYPDKESSILYKYGVPFRREPLLMNNLNKVQSIIRTYNDRLRLRLNINPIFGTMMIGGNIGSNIYTSSRVEDMPKYTSHILLQELNDYKNRLSKHNKSISPNDNEKLTSLLRSLGESEEKLYKFIAYTDKYIDLLELYGQSDGDSVLSYDNLKKFVDARESYFTKVSKKQTNLLSILQELVNLINSEVVKK